MDERTMIGLFIPGERGERYSLAPEASTSESNHFVWFEGTFVTMFFVGVPYSGTNLRKNGYGGSLCGLNQVAWPCGGS